MVGKPGALVEAGWNTRWGNWSGSLVAQTIWKNKSRCFLLRWSLANEHKRAVTVHCLKAWGRLLELVESHPHEGPGFLLHSYGGPVEMVPEFLNLGAYFSFSGGFMHPRKSRQLEVFKTIPMERLLLETDAPEMLPPSDWCFCPLSDTESGKAINHPGNIRAIYEFVSSEWGASHIRNFKSN